MKSIPLADVRHAPLHDHSYARDLSYEQAATKDVTDVPKAKRALDFTETETLDVFEIECKTEEEIGDDEWMLSDMSDFDESDLSDNDFDFKIEEISDSENNDWDIKTEVPDDDEEKESSN